MSKLTVQEVANIWFDRLTKKEIGIDELVEFSIMCADNEMERAEVECQIHMDLLKNNGVLDLVLELKKKYENDIIKANETGQTNLVDDFIEECVIRKIHPMDILLLVDFELRLKGDK